MALLLGSRKFPTLSHVLFQHEHGIKYQLCSTGNCRPRDLQAKKAILLWAAPEREAVRTRAMRLSSRPD